MGTTMTAALVGEHDVAIAHVGDSRAYRLRDGQLERLTEDHSLVEELAAAGKLTAEEADEHPQRSVITRAVGPEARRRGRHAHLARRGGRRLPHLQRRPDDDDRRGARGRHRPLGHDLEDAGRTLIDAANDAGGRDNITVVLFRSRRSMGAIRRSRAADQHGPGGADDGRRAGRGGARAADVETATPPASSAEPRRLQPRQPAAAPPPKRQRRGRRFAVLFAVVAVLFVPLVFGAYVAIQAVYFVGADEDGFVTVYRGLPYELPVGIELYKENYVSGVPMSSLPARRREQLTDHTLRSNDDVYDLVRELELGRLQS